MVHQASELSPEQRAAAELLLGRRLDGGEVLSVQAFSVPQVPAEQRREVKSRLEELFAQVDRNLGRDKAEEAQDVFSEAMRSSRPGFRLKP
ncbi:MAG: hypothetical protein IT168_02825 [Bryobacterales bacterium]|nr:hypothetical protein [Bryobacterales bacterium]